MGERKKPKKYHKMGYQQKELYVQNELKKLGGEGVYRQDSGGRGSASTGMFDLEASEAKLQSLASNDYDRRESIKYGKESGDKRFKDVGNGGFGSMNELVNADRAIAKYGYNELGHTNMSSDNDYAAVSSSLFDASRDKFQSDMESDMADKYATADKLNALQDKIKERAEQSGPVEISSTLTNAQRDMGEYDEDLTQQGANIFGAMGSGNDLEQATDETMAQEASGDGEDYKTQYTANVKGGLQLSGIETRGPNSGLMRDGSGFG